MLAGQQWSMYHPVLGLWLNVADWMDEDEQRWRQRPVFNRILPWYIITHARATENPPIVTFTPGPDRIDAELAEVMDISHKILWRELGMVDVIDRLMGWVIVGGAGHLISRIDMNAGPLKKWIGTAAVPVLDYETEEPMIDERTGEPVMQEVPDVPLDEQGNPLAVITADGQLEITGEPHQAREGALKVDVLSPLQVRGEWGPTAWHEKRYHLMKTFETPEEVWDRYGVDVEPTVRGGQAADVNELERILFGTGFYGAANSESRNQSSHVSTEGFVEVTHRWDRPLPYPGMEETEESPGGRYLCVAGQKTVLYDGPRQAPFPYTSPINTIEFVRIPGRHGGTTPQEAMNPTNKAYNSGFARIQEHVNLSTNPKALIDQQSGILAGQFSNAPGDNYLVTRRPGVPAVEYVAPPALGGDVYRLQEMLLNEMIETGNLRGTEGEIPSPSASGELVKELRFNSDRFLGPTLRRAVEEIGRTIETWGVLLPIIWDEQKILTYAGDDNVARTIVVMPEMFQQGKIQVVPDVESMLPEGRGEKQAQVFAMYMNGLFGPPGSPEAVNRFYELAHFPHMSRLARPGGIDRVTAEQENGQLVQGADPRTIPVYEWYDHAVHLQVLENFMKSPEFKKQHPQIQNGFVFHRQAHMMYLQQQAMQQAVMQAEAQAMAGGGGGKPAGNGAAPGGSKSIQPGPPEAPRGEVPGGKMPTALPAAGIPA